MSNAFECNPFVELYNAATPAERAEGKRWYDDAGSICACIAASTNNTVDNVAYAMSALSCNAAWDDNVTFTRRAAASHAAGRREHVGTMRKNEAVAYAQLDGARDKMFNGDKVNAFARAILGDPDAVVVDRWMYRAAGLRDDYSPRRFRRVEALIRHAAWQVGVSPRELQAVCWVHIRNMDSDTALEVHHA